MFAEYLSGCDLHALLCACEDYHPFPKRQSRDAWHALPEDKRRQVLEWRKEAERGYALYEQTMNKRTQTGLVACASIDDYCDQVIRRHENTRPEKEEDRVRHIDACSAQTGPIFLAYRKNAVIQEITEHVKCGAPHFDFVAEDGIRHRGWSITDPEQIKAIQTAFAGIDRIYIADGHHRAASAVRVGLQRRREHPGYGGAPEVSG